MSLWIVAGGLAGLGCSERPAEYEAASSPEKGDGSAEQRAASPVRRPNFVLIIADDFDHEHLGLMGHQPTHTPNIDRLAAEGVVFPATYTQARCRPTLAGLLSGLPPRRSRVYFNFKQASAQALHGQQLLPGILRNAGYATYAQGKLWEGAREKMGFTHGPGRDLERLVRESQDELFTFLDAVGDQPFFVWYAPMLPHVPHNPPPRHADRFRPEDVPVPDWIAADQRAAFQKAEATSFAMEAWLDEGVGELLGQLEKQGHLEQTLVIFLIDNGWANGFLSKGTPYDKGIRTPLVFRWAGHVPAERSFDELASYLDVVPTVLDYADIPIPRTLPGESLRQTINGADGRRRDALIGATYAGFSAPTSTDHRGDALALYVRTPRYKYIRWLQDIVEDQNEHHLRIKHFMLDFPARRAGDEELYDLEVDPHEHHDLARTPEKQEQLAALRAQALAWWEDENE